MLDGDFWLRLLKAGGNLAIVGETVAEIRLTGDFAAARLWYRVMRDYVPVARRLGVRLSPDFFRLLAHRELGLDPSAGGAWRGVPAALGRCRYAAYLGSLKLAAGIDRVRTKRRRRKE